MIRNRIWRTAALVALAVSLFSGVAGPAEARNKRLSNPYTYTMGDDIAKRMAAIFRITAGLEPATMVSYDRKAHNLVAEILGSTEEIEGAKREIEGFVQAIRDGVAPYARKQHGIDLADTDVTLIYYNDTGDEPPYEIVRRENGVFVEPAPESGD
ncbi:MAG: hypothetical protein AABZ94_04025 [Candidatus Eisenbacteria bacterium]